MVLILLFIVFRMIALPCGPVTPQKNPSSSESCRRNGRVAVGAGLKQNMGGRRLFCREVELPTGLGRKADIKLAFSLKVAGQLSQCRACRPSVFCAISVSL